VAREGLYGFGMMGRRGMSATEEIPYGRDYGKANEVWSTRVVWNSVGAIMVSIEEVLLLAWKEY